MLEQKTSLCFSTTTTLQVCRIGTLLTMDPHTPRQDEGAADPESKAQKQTVVSVDREHRDGCASWVKPVSGGRV